MTRSFECSVGLHMSGAVLFRGALPTSWHGYPSSMQVAATVPGDRYFSAGDDHAHLAWHLAPFNGQRIRITIETLEGDVMQIDDETEGSKAEAVVVLSGLCVCRHTVTVHEEDGPCGVRGCACKRFHDQESA